MSAVLEDTRQLNELHDNAPVVVVGTGPVGIRVVEELLKRDPARHIVVYGNEPWEPYNRVRLSSLLSGEIKLAGILSPLRLPVDHRVVQHHNREVVHIDRTRRLVTDRTGTTQHYSKLVLATGSRPHIPVIEGIDKPGVFTFRNLDDAQLLMARRSRCRRAVVLGGGLLGLEAARGLQKGHIEVTVIEHANRLMAQQLDEGAAELLRERLLALNLKVVLSDSVKRVVGADSVAGVSLRSGRDIPCDTLVVAAGIRPNIELARDAGLSVGRGIRVNDQMQTSDPDIFAVGECAEHRERIYGLVAPGLEQAGVAAHCIQDGTSSYTGSQAATRLKVAGINVFSVGRTGEDEVSSQLRTLAFRSYDGRGYRKVLLKRNRLVGAIAYGDWPEVNRVQEAVQHRRAIWPWQQRRFLGTGRLWPEQDAARVADWPASAVVCQCTGVTRGTLSQAVQAGHCSVESLCAHTGASSVCGSCKPLLAELAGSDRIDAEPGSRTLLWSGVVTLLAALTYLLTPAIPFADTVQVALRWDLLWRDGLLKQVSGFTLLGLGVLLSALSLRKRLGLFSFGSFSGWRLVHVLLGAVAVVALLTHTGLRLGYNLNLLLMLDFIGLLLAGSVAGGIVGVQHLMPRAGARRARDLSLWLHILLLWPLPALLGFHILKSYWF